MTIGAFNPQCACVRVTVVVLCVYVYVCVCVCVCACVCVCYHTSCYIYLASFSINYQFLTTLFLGVISPEQNIA